MAVSVSDAFLQVLVCCAVGCGADALSAAAPHLYPSGIIEAVLNRTSHCPGQPRRGVVSCVVDTVYPVGRIPQ